MKTKFYLLSVGFALLVSGFAGCSKGEDPIDPPTPPPPPPPTESYEIKIENLTPLSADASVEPADEEQLYFFNSVRYVDYEAECEGTPEGLCNYINDFFAQLADNGGNPVPLSMVLSSYCYQGYQVSQYALLPNVKYIVFAVSIDENTGTTVGDPVIEEFSTPAASGAWARLTIESRPGGRDELNPDTKITVNCKSNIPVAYAAIGLFSAQTIAELQAEGLVPEDIVGSYGTLLNSESMEELSSADGLVVTFKDLIAGTKYVFIAKVRTPGGRVTVKTADQSTTAATETSVSGIGRGVYNPTIIPTYGMSSDSPGLTFNEGSSAECIFLMRR